MRNHMRALVCPRGFSLMEMLFVLAIIAIIAFMALPDVSIATVRSQIKESNALITVAKTAVGTYHTQNGKMPADNAEALLPEPGKLVGKFVARIEVKDGALHITWGNSVFTQIKETTLSLRPAYVEDQPLVPLSWVCARAAVPTGMRLAGSDRTSMPAKYVPLECRGAEAPK
jgi:type IV pilus assembly protein PilA